MNAAAPALGRRRAPSARSERATLARSIAFHGAAFLLAFLATSLAVAWAPEAMLAVYARWATVMQAAGARSAQELGSAAEVFHHVLGMNAVALGLFAAVAYIGQGVLALPFAGAFYALVGLLAPHAIGRPLAAQDWLLVGLESGALVTASALAAAVGGHRFGFGADLRSLIAFWTRDRRRWWPAPVAPWREVRARWSTAATWTSASLTLVWLVAAALEAWGG